MSANDTQVGGTHYQTNKALRGIEHWDWCYHNNYDIFQVYISKYVHRHKEKNGVEDLKKARHTLDKYIEVLEEQAQHQYLKDLKHPPHPMNAGYGTKPVHWEDFTEEEKEAHRIAMSRMRAERWRGSKAQ